MECNRIYQVNLHIAAVTSLFEPLSVT